MLDFLWKEAYGELVNGQQILADQQDTILSNYSNMIFPYLMMNVIRSVSVCT